MTIARWSTAIWLSQVVCILQPNCHSWSTYCNMTIAGGLHTATWLSQVVYIPQHNCHSWSAYCNMTITGGLHFAIWLSQVVYILQYDCQRWSTFCNLTVTVGLHTSACLSQLLYMPRHLNTAERLSALVSTLELDYHRWSKSLQLAHHRLLQHDYWHRSKYFNLTIRLNCRLWMLARAGYRNLVLIFMNWTSIDTS